MSRNQAFDPSGLERAVIAIRELNQSPHAHKTLELMQKQEEAKKAEFSTKQTQLEIQKIKVDGEERRKNLEIQKQNTKEISEYNDKLERQRFQDQLVEKEKSHQKIREENEESVRRQETIRRETIQMQMQKQHELEEKKILLKAKLESENYRNNYDLIRQDIRMKAEIEQQGRKDIHAIYLQKLSEAYHYFRMNPYGLYTFGVGMLYISGGLYLSKYGLALMFKKIESTFMQPTLVRETSRSSFSFKGEQQKIFDKVVLNTAQEEQLQLITASLIGKQTNIAPLRNFLFYGPPGTGKTLFAKQLAYNSGLHYAVIAGGDVEKLGINAVNEIDKLFKWVNGSNRGTIIFIDEAETIFYKRSKNSQTSSALSALLAQTSSASNKFSLIIATNIPQHLDEAILDRVDQIVKFDYLTVDKRVKLIWKGLSKVASKKSFSLLGRKTISIDFVITEDEVQQLAELLEKFSPRQIDKFLLSVHDSALGYAIINKVKTFKVNFEFIQKILKNSLQDQELRQKWL